MLDDYRPLSTLQCGLRLYYSADLRIQTYTEPVPLKYGKLVTKYPWIYRYFYGVTSVLEKIRRRFIKTNASVRWQSAEIERLHIFCLPRPPVFLVVCHCPVLHFQSTEDMRARSPPVRPPVRPSVCRVHYRDDTVFVAGARAVHEADGLRPDGWPACRRRSSVAGDTAPGGERAFIWCGMSQVETRSTLRRRRPSHDNDAAAGPPCRRR